jgi:hypothetical protein
MKQEKSSFNIYEILNGAKKQAQWIFVIGYYVGTNIGMFAIG